jgi:N-methylhydantoinase B/oxoprolinase/acetone carboxylase alpha subunit
MRNRRTPDPALLDKEAEVVKLRRGGLTWDMIADRTGYKSPSAALAAYQRAAKRIVQDDIESIRKIEAERLDMAQSAIWGSVLSGNIPAVATLIRIQERRAKLLGLDQPVRQQIEVTN